MGWTLALGGQSIEGVFVEGASVAGIGTATVTMPRFEKCGIGVVTMPPSILRWCGIGAGAGQFTAGSAGQYFIIDCVSMVPGSGSPVFVFSGMGSTTGINTRRWSGGAQYTLDTQCTLSHEVVTGGGTTITPADANVEIRGITRSVTLNLSDTDSGNVIQFVGTTGPITITASGAADNATVNLYGVSASLADAGHGTTNDYTVNQENINIEADTALTDYDPPTKLEMDSGFAALNDLTAAQVNAEVDTALADYDGPTKAELDNAVAPLATSAALATVDGNVDAILLDTGTDGVLLANDAITRDKYDESTAFPLRASDTGSTEVARTGADGDSLETISDEIAALNDVSLVDVNAAVDIALVDIHLDHLLAVDYDPASKPGVATALLNELVEDDGGVSRYTENALEEGPTGDVTVSAAAVWAYVTRTLTGSTGGITIISAVSGSKITVYANDTWSFTLTDSDLALTDYEALAFVVRGNTGEDDDAILIVRDDDGLVRIGGAAPINAANGTLTNIATAFSVLIAIDETDIETFGNKTWFLKGFDTTPATDEGYTLATGTFTINRPGLQAQE